ncbi:MAG TPA: GNAT family N-acetyltransferase [Chthonomonadaceae bacterium]|nr:GNAT family N-acetyltransferase [Chthonomonadaceae bacterium]
MAEIAALEIRRLETRDPLAISSAFTAMGWNKPAAQYERYLREQAAGERVVLLAFVEGEFAGYLCVVWEPGYPPFRDAGIPEIQDFNVVARYRRQGIGSALMEEAERFAAERSPVVGIGVGMTADYGAAQRLYVRRGYVPDGRGLTADNRPLAWGDQVTVDDNLVLHFTKRINN